MADEPTAAAAAGAPPPPPLLPSPPTRQYLEQTVYPTLFKALCAADRARPTDVAGFLAEQLRAPPEPEGPAPEPEPADEGSPRAAKPMAVSEGGDVVSLLSFYDTKGKLSPFRQHPATPEFADLRVPLAAVCCSNATAYGSNEGAERDSAARAAGISGRGTPAPAADELTGRRTQKHTYVRHHAHTVSSLLVTVATRFSQN